ncbi:hypothetical protein W03_09640 [Nitrosomonas sp. PY1]|uniref:hypothetical protein n=1 Tax=Nitrosomonas sp. PY1 TaxID=1803906 RepID=UPI001FC89A5E|nr:hypothetical protein [Nitrosomonas sp. PY1]GKS68960.1 hypothetical protein W03_09640 [Nitrosomonas sp. PY1]
MIFYRDMKNYRAPEEPIVLRNVVFTLAIIVLVIFMGYLGEEEHQSKLEQIAAAKQSTNHKGN